MTKSGRLNLRTTPEQDILIRRAATVKGQNVTDFVLTNAVESALRVLENFERMDRTTRDSRMFVDALLAPPEPTAKARAAARRHKALSDGQQRA